MSQSFRVLDHLDYLRLRVIRAALAFVAASIAGFALAPMAIERLVRTDVGLDGLVFLSPTEALVSRMKLALAIGLVLSLPVILYQLWALFVPAMDRRQKRATLVLIPAVYLLFVLGILFALSAVLPATLRFLLGFGGGGLQQEISVSNYISFVINFALPFGAVFELPVVVVALTRLGLVRPEALAKNRKYTIFGIFVVAAVLTPPDVISQMMLGLPVLLLFEISLLLARWFRPKRGIGEQSA